MIIIMILVVIRIEIKKLNLLNTVRFCVIRVDIRVEEIGRVSHSERVKSIRWLIQPLVREL